MARFTFERPMKALTICQPYPHLICLPDSDPRHKRVENRTWETNYRGPLAIHAGKSRKWLKTFAMPREEVKALAFGAVVAIADLTACIEVVDCDGVKEFISHGRDAARVYPWIENHIHAEGPFCWVLQNIRILKHPIDCQGELGLWSWVPPRGLELIDADEYALQFAIAVEKATAEEAARSAKKSGAKTEKTLF